MEKGEKGKIEQEWERGLEIEEKEKVEQEGGREVERGE